MAHPVVHFEITGRDPQRLRDYYAAVHDWDLAPPSTVAAEVSDAEQYHFLDLVSADDGAGIRGGIGGGPGFTPGTVFYVGVDDVAAAVARAEQHGGRCVLGPVTSPQGLVVAHVADPEGNVTGLAGG